MSDPSGSPPEMQSKNESSGSSVKTRAERLARLYAMYEESFKTHAVAHQHWDPQLSSFILRRPDSVVFYAEIMVSRRSVTLQGDLHLMSFSGGPQDHLAKIAWLANARNGYLAEKAAIGTGCSEMVWEYDHDFARSDLLYERRSGNITKEQAAAAWQALQWDSNPQKAMRAIYETGQCDEYPELGRCIDSRVILAHAAVKRLAQLLL